MVESRKDSAGDHGRLRGATPAQPGSVRADIIDEASSDLGSRFFIRIREQMGCLLRWCERDAGTGAGLFAFI